MILLLTESQHCLLPMFISKENAKFQLMVSENLEKFPIQFNPYSLRESMDPRIC